MNVSELKIGQKVKIIGFEKDEISIKLMEMGVIPGEEIWIEKVAPLKDPISVNIAGYSLSLRLSEAETILVSF